MHLNTPPREDDICDVIGKFLRAHSWTSKILSEKSGIPLALCKRVSDEDFPKTPEENAILPALAKTLTLSLPALKKLNTYQPSISPPPELIHIVTDFGYAGVNSYILTLGSEAVAFDTGTNAKPMLNYIKKHDLTLKALYITHEHHDHIAGISDFSNIPIFTPNKCSYSQHISLANSIYLTALDTSGHFTPSCAYFIKGLETPFCISGDIIYAGSMGQANSPENYQTSLNNAYSKLMTLPKETIICPGHGPLTTVELESKNNPFLAKS